MQYGNALRGEGTAPRRGGIKRRFCVGPYSVTFLVELIRGSSIHCEI
jgi:hypothetical protein